MKRLASAGLAWGPLAMLALLVAAAAFYPEREARGARHLAGWLGTLALGVAWAATSIDLHRRARAGTLSRGWVWAAFALLALAALAVPAFHSSDVHAYVQVGRLQTAHDANPYVTVPADLPPTVVEADPLIGTTWADTPCTYGFGFALVARGIVAAAGDDLDRAILLFKVFGLLGLLLCAVGTFALSRRLARDDDATITALLLLSPWTLLHFVSNAHNDMWMGACLVLAAWALHARRWWLVLPLLVAGALMKHLALVALPFFALAVWRQGGWRALMPGAVLASLLAWACATPYIDAIGTDELGRIGAILTTPWNSISAALHYTWTRTLGAEGDAIAEGIRLGFAVAFVVFAGWRFLSRLGPRAAREAYDTPSAIEDAATTLFVLLFVCSAAWHPWYPGMVLGLMLCLPKAHVVRRMAIAVTAFQLLAFTPLAKARVLEALVMLVLPMALVLWQERRGATTGRPGSP